MNKQMQVKDLYEYCKEQIDKGNGDKYIIVADDTEGNGYHGMFFGFTEDVAETIDTNYINDSQFNNPNELIILG